VREDILEDLAGRAVKDPAFLRQARKYPRETLTRYGYHLSEEEMRLVEGLRRRTAGMSDEELVRTLAAGLEGRRGDPPAKPTAPSWRGVGPARPARPGS
jgi:hypothetical protein